MNGSLQALLTQKPIAVVPGAYDALTAMLAASAGFPAFHVSGPIVGAQELEDLDCSRVIFPGAIVRAIAHTAREFYSTLADDGASGALRHRMFDSDALNELIGTPQMMEEGKRYVGDAPAPRKVDFAL